MQVLLHEHNFSVLILFAVTIILFIHIFTFVLLEELAMAWFHLQRQATASMIMRFLPSDGVDQRIRCLILLQAGQVL